MNPSTLPALCVIALLGCVLLLGTARQIFSAHRQQPAAAVVTFDSAPAPSQPSAEPLFPGLPSR